MRCFVAIDLSVDVRSALLEVQGRLRAAAGRADVRWVDPPGLHLTLKFLGRVEDAQVSELASALAAASASIPPLELTTGGVGAFPTLTRPRVVWVGLAAGASEVVRLAVAVDRAFAPLGFPPEARPFHPHVTLARVRSPRGLGPLVKAMAGEMAGATARPVARGEAARASTWGAREVVLYQSHLKPTGAVYEAVARLPLGTPEA